MAQNKEKENLGKGLGKAKISPKVLLWSCVACIVLTMIIGFTLGGWVTGGLYGIWLRKLQKRLSSIAWQLFVSHNSNRIPEKDKKLEELEKTSLGREVAM